MIAAPKKSNSQSEPTTRELLELMHAGFEEGNRRFERIEGILSTLQIGQDNLLVEVHDIKRCVIRLEYKVDEMQEMLHDLSEAEAKDAVASINHEGRIVRLEKIHKVKSVPPQHLADTE